MKQKQKYKITIDSLLTILLPILMAYTLTGQIVHEWIGLLMIILFILHITLNSNWYRNLFRLKYTSLRIVQTVINLMLLASIISLIFSGFLISDYVFDFVDIREGIAFAWQLHMMSAYWAFVLMALHLGMNGNVVKGMVNKHLGIGYKLHRYKTICLILSISITVYGMYVFIRNDIISYMLLIKTMVFYDSQQSAIVYFTGNIAIMMLFSFCGYYLHKILMIFSGKKLA